MRLLLVGGTGLVGRHVLELALADERVMSVTAPVRRAIPVSKKLHAPILDFDRLPVDEDWWSTDAVVCALGTTIKLAGSRAAFRKVDHDYALAVARLARAGGARTFVLTRPRARTPRRGSSTTA